MKAMLVKTIRNLTTTPKDFALEAGIPVEDAEKVLEFALNPETPEDCIAILDETEMSDGTVIVAGNVVDEDLTVLHDLMRG